MPNKLVKTAAEGLPSFTRRLFLGGAAAASLPVAAVAAPAVVRPLAPSIDEFLARALPAERIRYHSNALAEAMAELNPERIGWRVHTDHEHDFVLVVPHHKPGLYLQHTGRKA